MNPDNANVAFPSRQEIETLLAERIAADDDFRDELEADPRKSIGQLLGRVVPPEITFILHDESLLDIHLVLPSESNVVQEDLT